MKTYGELNLLAIRDKHKLDIAHYSYLKGMDAMTSPLEFPKRFWRDKNNAYRWNYTCLIFKNSDDLDGRKSKADFVQDEVYLTTRFRDNQQQEEVLKDLQLALGDEYQIFVPEEITRSIYIRLIKKPDSE